MVFVVGSFVSSSAVSYQRSSINSRGHRGHSGGDHTLTIVVWLIFENLATIRNKLHIHARVSVQIMRSIRKCNIITNWQQCYNILIIIKT